MTRLTNYVSFLTLLTAFSAAADIIQFDDLAPGTTLTTQYPAITTTGSPVISAFSNVSKFNCLAEVEPSTATAVDGGGFIMLDFASAQSRVKVRAGYELDPSATKGGPATITLTAWGYDNKTSSFYVAATDVKTVAGPGVYARMEVCRALSNDIVAIDIEASGGRIEVVDNLEFFDYAPEPSWTANFDAVPAGTFVSAHYPGLQFTENTRAVGAALMSTTAGSGSQIVVPNSQPESHTAAFSFELEPAQGAVKLLTGYPGSSWNSNPLLVRVQAFDAAGTEVARADRTYAALRPLNDPVEICRWDQRDIARVSVHFLNADGSPRSLGGVECFDSVEYGPVDPATISDAIPPQVFISNPSVHTDSLIMQHRDDNTRSFALEAYSFENVSQAEMWVEQMNTVTLATTTIPLTFSQLGEIPTYTPPGGAPVAVPSGYEVQTASTVIHYGVGSWRFRVLARDSAGNVSVVSTDNERLRTLAPLAASTYAASPPATTFMGTANEPVAGMPWAPPVSAQVTRYTLAGTNLHRDSHVVFVRGWETGHPTGRERYAAPATPGSLNAARTSVEVNLPGPCANLAANAGANLWELWVQDTWSRPGAVDWTKLGDVRVGPWFSEMYGYRFRNVGDNSFGLADFDCIYGRTLMLNGARDGIRNPSRMLFAAVGLPILSAGEGHCFGYSMTVSHMRRRWLDPRIYADLSALTAHDIPGTGPGPALYRGGDLLELALPDSLFAQIKAFHGGQLSDEVINHVMNQMSGHFSWQGNPVAVLNRIRANPHDYIVTMLSLESLSSSHVLTPYAVRDLDATWSEIHVYDSNYHGTINSTERGPINPVDGRPRWTVGPEHGRNTRILVNKVTNEYSYCLNDPFRGTSSDHRYLSGTGLYSIPVSMFRSDRRPPGVLGLLGRVLWMFIAGSAEARYSNPAGQMVGINPDGSEVNALPGAYALPLSTTEATEEPRTTRVPFGLGTRGTAIGQITAEMRNTGSEGSHFYAGDSGVIFQLSSKGATAGETDRVVIDRAVNPIDSAALIPGGNGRTWFPRVGVESEDGSAVVWRVMGLEAGAGERIEFAPRSGSAAGGDEWLDLRNRTGHALVFRLVLERGNAASTAPDAATYGPLTIPSGGDVRLYPLPDSRMNFAVDANADGTPESLTPLTGTALYSGSTPLADCDGNGIPDALDIAEGRLADANENLIPDTCEVEASAAVTLTSLDATPGNPVKVALSLQGTPGTAWKLQRSPDLLSWGLIESVTFGADAVSRTVFEPAGTARIFYRLVPD